MSEAEFEAYKLSVREKRKNRLYTHWRNMQTGNDCKSIGPASQCFCGHRYKDHFFDNVDNKNVYCRSQQKCKCKLFCYIPICKSRSFSKLIFQLDLRTSNACVNTHVMNIIQIRKNAKELVARAIVLISRLSILVLAEHPLMFMRQFLNAGKNVRLMEDQSIPNGCRTKI